MNKVLLYGGLGNQMFQYALALAMQEKGINTRISLSNFFCHVHHNGFSMREAFNVPLPFPVNVQHSLLSKGRGIFQSKVSTHILRMLVKQYYKFHKVYQEKREFEYDQEVFAQTDTVFSGIWQAEEYFRPVAYVIREHFTFNQPEDELNKGLIEEIASSNAVSVHIRRGDYLQGKWANTHAVIKGTRYFQDAIRHMCDAVQEPRFYVFSDDMEWVRQNIEIPNCTYVTHNKGSKAYLDMYLMSLCNHNIISNSTFSWWGAWLNKNPGKIVIMPNRWLNIETARGIFPEKWIKLAVG